MPTRKPYRRTAPADPHRPWTDRKIGIYPRLSDDPDETKAGIQRQTDDGVRLARSRGAAETVVHVETDTSAWKRKRVHSVDPQGRPITVLRVIRPVWSQVLEDLRAGVIDGVVVADLDRMVRDPRDLEDIIDVVNETGRLVLSCSGDLNLTTEDGIAMARVAVAFANKSSAATSRRVTRAHSGRADEGLPVVRGKNQRAYGYSKNGLEIVESEAALLRRAADDILYRGATIADVVNQWRFLGHLSAGGRPWTWAHLWAVLSNPRICGYRSTIAYGDPAKGERSTFYVVHTNAEGKEVQGVWPEIISRSKWDQLQRVIGGGALRRTTRSGKASQLLVGILRCGACGSRIYAQSWLPRGFVEPTHRYRCPPKRMGGCGSVSVGEGHLADADMISRYLAEFDAGRVMKREVSTPELREIDRELADLEAQRDGRVISVSTWAVAADVLMNRRAALVASGGNLRVVHDPAAARRQLTAWEGASMDMRRRMLHDWAPKGVLLLKATRYGAPYSPDRLVLITDDSISSVADTNR